MGEAHAWTFRELAEDGQLEYSDGYRTKEAEIGATGYPILRVAEVLDGRIAPTFTEFVRPEFRGAMKGKVSRPGDVVLTTKGTVGRVALMPSDEGEFVYSPQVCYFRVADGSSVDARFLYYWFRSGEFRRQAAGLKGQTDMADYLNLSDIGGLRIAPPMCGEQRAIAEVLGALDDKIALNERICAISLELADCYSQILYQDANAATVATLAQLAAEGQLEFGDGYRTKRAEHGKPGFPILRVAEVADGEIRPAFADYVSDDYRPAIGRKTSRPGDVVLTTKGTVGRVALISADYPEFVYSPQVCYFRPVDKSRLPSVYLFHWMRGPEFWRQAAGMKGQTDMADYLSLGDIKSLHITLPSPAALADFTQRCAPLHSQTAAVRNENRTLADLRDTLLPQLLSGKLRVKDAVRTVEEVV